MAIILTVFAAISSYAKVTDGPGGTGGGDEYVLDFISVGYQEVYPWLVKNGSRLSPAVDAKVFLQQLSQYNIFSKDKVFEKCDGTQTGKEFQACYNKSTGKIMISRSLWPIKELNSPTKRGTVAHEVFRRMGIEGDKYEVTRQIPILSIKRASSGRKTLVDWAYLDEDSKEYLKIFQSNFDYIEENNSVGNIIFSNPSKASGLGISVEPYHSTCGAIEILPRTKLIYNGIRKELQSNREAAFAISLQLLLMVPAGTHVGLNVSNSTYVNTSGFLLKDCSIIIDSWWGEFESFSGLNFPPKTEEPLDVKF